ncbi:hypothetical protein KEM54_005420 [Ascosphaera aggregata]|nr:hypothetical protein KEM54_005420 [Ascosphaera aggregata]
MSMNKLGLGRFKSWAGGVMSNSDARSNMSEELQRDLEEMDIRCAGVERMDRAMRTYLKYLTKRVPGENKDTPFPSANLGATMIRQGDEMPRDSELGNRLAKFGQINVRIASFQEQYVADATSSWQESLERALAQMKDYQAARKILEMRRKDYDAVVSRVAKAKRDDPANEEDLRKKTALYEESQRDVCRRIQDIRDAEDGDMDSLDRFLDAELAFHESCMNALQRLRSEWSSKTQPFRNAPSSRLAPPTTRSRSSTARSHGYATVNEEEEYSQNYDAPSVRPHLTSYNRSSSYTHSHGNDESPTESYGYASKSRSHSPEQYAKNYRSHPASTSTFEGPTTSARRNGSITEESYFPSPSIRDRDRSNTFPSRDPAAPNLPLRTKRSQNFFSANADYDSLEDTPAFCPRTPSSSSVATTPGYAPEGTRSIGAVTGTGKKPPPPPPRSKKPPPPPPKRVASSAN